MTGGHAGMVSLLRQAALPRFAHDSSYVHLVMESGVNLRNVKCS